MGNIVGIYLGTTNSAAALKVTKAAELVTAPDNIPPDYKLTPSAVALTSNGFIVGYEAYRQLRQNPENVVISVMNLIGRDFDDEVVQQQKKRLNCEIAQASEGTENIICIKLGGKEYAPEDIVAEILKKMVQNAQNYQAQMGQTAQITEAVITIPAYFNDKQRYATQLAATRAGLKVRELLSEPTAAAISYNFNPNSDEVKTLLVYDFGGGTFDSSVITVSGSQFIESGKAGDLWLGGDDIDNQLMEFVKQRIAQQENLENIDQLIDDMNHYQRVRFLGDLKTSVEQAKIDLSTKTTTRIIPATPLLDDLGMAIEIDVEITREQFESMILPLVERTITICKDAIQYSNYPEELIDLVLLVGGSSQIPLVQQKVSEAFGAHRVVLHPDPIYAIAQGAAIVTERGLGEDSLTAEVVTLANEIKAQEDKRILWQEVEELLQLLNTKGLLMAEKVQSIDNIAAEIVELVTVIESPQAQDINTFDLKVAQEKLKDLNLQVKAFMVNDLPLAMFLIADFSLIIEQGCSLISEKQTRRYWAIIKDIKRAIAAGNLVDLAEATWAAQTEFNSLPDELFALISHGDMVNPASLPWD